MCKGLYSGYSTDLISSPRLSTFNGFHNILILVIKLLLLKSEVFQLSKVTRPDKWTNVSVLWAAKRKCHSHSVYWAGSKRLSGEDLKNSAAYLSHIISAWLDTLMINWKLFCAIWLSWPFKKRDNSFMHSVSQAISFCISLRELCILQQFLCLCREGCLQADTLQFLLPPPTHYRR